MSYYDDYYDDCLSDDDDYDVYYHNYSVDYANQLLNGHHAITSCLPRQRRKHHRHTPRLVRVATLDQMPITNRPQVVPALHSQPKYGINQQIPVPPLNLTSRLPTLEATNEEMERRISRRPEPISEVVEEHDGPPIITANNIINATTTTQDDTHRPLTEEELRQVQQQQEAFQQHLLNMQRHILEQGQQAGEQQQREQETPTIPSSASHFSKKRTKKSFHDLERDDDQAEIAELIENDPYFAAAMEDFAYSHGLLHKHRHRTHSDESSSSHQSQHLCKKHRTQFQKKPPSRRLSHSSSSSSAPISIPAVHRPLSDPRGPNADLILLRELQGIRRVMEEYVQDQRNRPNPPPAMYPPWGSYESPYQPSVFPQDRPQPKPHPNQVVYQNVVNAVKEALERRSPSQREQPLKPSEIDPTLKHTYTRRPQIPPPTIKPQQQVRRPSSGSSSSSSSSPSTTTAAKPGAIPPAPPYEPLANFSSTRPPINQNRTLSYGKHENQSDIYDTLLPGHYLRLHHNKYN
ncbi:unnamed protein product [Adineta ricciae]|uniref:Uncharacterized protein n=1 Tax=Adineta ricciae TaxID=249248 RepID=A0A814Z5I8_ADIRI|nr:unnamed protein product [Adineta ricciae]CAF1562279.1 unnamed protein product [Adineta ricciae]